MATILAPRSQTRTPDDRNALAEACSLTTAPLLRNPLCHALP